MIKNNLKSKTFNDGVVQIYNVVNDAPPGDTPILKLILFQTLRYGEQRVGITRYYNALQSNIKISKVLRCPLVHGVDTEQVAIPNDGKQYEIHFVQTAEDEVNDVMTLSLVKKVTDYAVK